MLAKTLCVSLVLMMVLISALTLAQTNTRCTSKNHTKEPTMIPVGMKTVALPATENLSKVGVKFYDFAVISSNEVQLHLYDEAKSLLALVELVNDSSHNSLRRT